jgi:hypothetical protein
MNLPHPQPEIYEICIKGHLDKRWSSRFEAMTISPKTGGETLITGPVLDQAALYGLLKKVRDTGLPLLSVKRIKPDGPA